jgi:uncharacterized protein (TIGR03382 family)
MPRLALALAAVLPLVAAPALLPARAAADSAPPDRFGPCEGRQAGDPCCRDLAADRCWQEGCACVTVSDPDCPGGAASCLSCESDRGWCGSARSSGDSGGCATGAPAGAAALGLVGLAYLRRRRAGR